MCFLNQSESQIKVKSWKIELIVAIRAFPKSKCVSREENKTTIDLI